MLDPKNLENGKEQYETFTRGYGRKSKKYYCYDYRHTDGTLFSIVKSTLAECREAREFWLKHNFHYA